MGTKITSNQEDVVDDVLSSLAFTLLCREDKFFELLMKYLCVSSYSKHDS